jgi:hypothetical protein
VGRLFDLTLVKAEVLVKRQDEHPVLQRLHLAGPVEIGGHPMVHLFAGQAQSL